MTAHQRACHRGMPVMLRQQGVPVGLGQGEQQEGEMRPGWSRRWRVDEILWDSLKITLAFVGGKKTPLEGFNKRRT